MALTKVSRGLLSTSIVDNGNATAITIDSSENVGIGTTNPDTSLHVTTPSGTKTELNLAQTAVTNYRLSIPASTDALTFVYGANTERMRIDSSGNVLVGTTDSTLYNNTSGSGTMVNSFGRLDITRDDVMAIFNRNTSDGEMINFRKDGTTVGSIGTSTGGLYIADAGVGFRFDSGGTDDIIPCNATGGAADASINLGSSGARLKDLYLSGTATMGGLSVEGNGTYLASLNNTAQDARIQLSRGGTEFGQVSAGGNLMNLVASGSSTDMRFLTNGTERMRIDTSGNLLVGKTSTDDGVAGLRVSSLGVIVSTIASPSTNTYLMYSGGYKFYVNTNGGISNFSANNVNLSDEREKKNIELLESQWDSLKQWSLKKFHYNADDDSDNKKLGVIAQEVATHNPEVIDEFNVDDDTTRMAVKEQQMMWMAIKALQEAQTRIETLEARVTELENN